VELRDRHRLSGQLIGAWRDQQRGQRARQRSVRSRHGSSVDDTGQHPVREILVRLPRIAEVRSARGSAAAKHAHVVR
jgi:hypothetical protein